MLKQKKIIIAVISVFIVVVAGISVFLLVKKDKNNNLDPVENNSRVVNIDGESEEPGVVAVGGDFLGRQGVLYFDEDNMLTFVDASSGKKAYVCSDINCEHKPRAKGSDEVDCQAAALTKGTCLMNDKYIYVLGDFKQCADVNSVDIYRENIDGTDERIINSVEGVQLVVDAYIYDDMIVFTYLNTVDLSDINNPVDLDTPVGGLVCYDISTDKFIKHEVPVYDDNACEATAGYVSKNNDNILFLGLYSYQDGDSYMSKARMFEWNTTDDTLKEVCETSDMDVLCVSGQGWVYCNDTEMYLESLDGKNKVSLGGSGKPSVSFWMGDKLYYERFVRDKSYNCYVYDPAADKAELIGYHDVDMRYTACSNGYVWFEKHLTDDAGTFISTEFKRMMPQDYATGNYDKAEAFER